jgi:acyl carrier protein
MREERVKQRETSVCDLPGIKAIFVVSLDVTRIRCRFDTRFGPDLDADSLDHSRDPDAVEDKFGSRYQKNARDFMKSD